MITVDFFKDQRDMLKGFRVCGHAGLADYGSDVCCSSVSSAVMLTANTATEAFGLKAKVSVEENEIMFKLQGDENGEGDKLILGLLTHLYFLSDEFTGRIKVRVNSV